LIRILESILQLIMERFPVQSFGFTTGSKFLINVHNFFSKNLNAQLESATNIYLDQHVRIRDKDVIMTVLPDTKFVKVQLPILMKYFQKDFGRSKDDLVRWALAHLPPSTIRDQLRKLIETNSFSLKWGKYNWDFFYLVESKEKINVR
jgi:hypothetical protein